VSSKFLHKVWAEQHWDKPFRNGPAKLVQPASSHFSQAFIPWQQTPCSPTISGALPLRLERLYPPYVRGLWIWPAGARYRFPRQARSRCVTVVALHQHPRSRCGVSSTWIVPLTCGSPQGVDRQIPVDFLSAIRHTSTSTGLSLGAVAWRRLHRHKSCRQVADPCAVLLVCSLDIAAVWRGVTGAVFFVRLGGVGRSDCLLQW